MPLDPEQMVDNRRVSIDATSLQGRALWPFGLPLLLLASLFLLLAIAVADQQLTEKLPLAAWIGGGSVLLLLVYGLQQRWLRTAIRQDMLTLVALVQQMDQAQASQPQQGQAAAIRLKKTVQGAVQTKDPNSSRQTNNADISLDRAIFGVDQVLGPVSGGLPDQVDAAINHKTLLALGQAFADLLRSRGITEAFVAHDSRPSSESLYLAFNQGVASQGVQVIELGLIPVGLLHFAVSRAGQSASAMITGAEATQTCNGVQLTIDGHSLAADQLLLLHRRICKGEFRDEAAGQQPYDPRRPYIEAVSRRIQLSRRLKVVVASVDPGITALACDVLKALGSEPIPAHAAMPMFPQHPFDPDSQAAVAPVGRQVLQSGADLAILLDQEGARLGVLDEQGSPLPSEHLLMLLAADLLREHPGMDVIYDVRSSRHLANIIQAHGGRPVQWHCSRAMIRDRLDQPGGLLAGSYSGCVWINPDWSGWADALYAAARLLAIVAADAAPLSNKLKALPHAISTPEYHLSLPREQAEQLLQKIESEGDFGSARMLRLDGLKAEFDQGWGLVRSGISSPALIFRFEADDASALAGIQKQFRDVMTQLAPECQLPF